jgi:Uncharacterized protein conserved in bacteria
MLDPTFPSSIARAQCALAVMTKAPQAGQVKTRLIPPLTPHEAAELNKSFLRDTTSTISSAAMTNLACGIAVYTPVGTESVYNDILPPDFILLPQRGDNFGERLYFAAEDLFRCGFESVCLIDSDSPTVTAKSFSRAIELLSSGRDHVVLGPSDDGGYYLIGFNKLHSELFERIDWSTDVVLNQTKQSARKIGLDVKLLTSGYDVDDAGSLRRLCNELLADTAPTSVAPHTRRFLSKLTEQKKL